MKVFYDHQIFSLQDYGGISRIFTELILGSNSNSFQAHLSLLYSKNVHLTEAGVCPNLFLNRLPGFNRRKVMYGLNDLFNRWELKKQNYDIYHPTFYSTHLAKKIKKLDIVATFHDMTNELLSDKYEKLRDSKLFREKAELIKMAKRVIAVSENTKNDLIRIFDVNPDTISVIHLASSIQAKKTVESIVGQPYLLYVGNRRLYKNFIFLITAIAPLLIQYDLAFVCAGGGQFNTDEIEIFKNNHIFDRLRFVHVSDETLPDIYSRAFAFIFPSLYEGFGIPVLEAFSCNCPCILSSKSSLPEVGGNAALYFDPEDQNSIYGAVEKLVTNNSLRNKLIELGQEQNSKFSWDKHVRETFNVYEKVKNNG